jgi:hypothetical protein
MKAGRNLFIAVLSLALPAVSHSAAAQSAADQAAGTTSAAPALGSASGSVGGPASKPGIGDIAQYTEGSARYLLDHPRILARFLDLSAADETAALKLWSTLQETLTPLRQARPALCTALVGDLAAGTPDPATIGSATLALYDSRQQIIAAHQAFVTSFSAILDPAQLAAYSALRKLAFPGDEEYAVIGYCPHQAS